MHNGSNPRETHPSLLMLSHQTLSLGRQHPSSGPELHPLPQCNFLGSYLSVAVVGRVLNYGAIPVHSLNELCSCRPTAAFTSSPKFCKFWTLFNLSKSVGDFPLFAVSSRAAVIVLHSLLEHFWSSYYCLLRKLLEDFQNDEAFTCWQSDFLVSFPGQ